MTQAAAIQQCTDDEPFVLLGHSTGGLFAHLIAEYLHSLGAPPAGLIKLDTYTGAGLAEVAPQVLTGMAQLTESFFDLTDDRLTAMTAYFELVAGHEPGPIDSERLLVRATDPMPSVAGDPIGGARWDGAQVLDVPGDHFSMMERHATETAAVVEKWLFEHDSLARSG